MPIDPILKVLNDKTAKTVCTPKLISIVKYKYNVSFHNSMILNAITSKRNSTAQIAVYTRTLTPSFAASFDKHFKIGSASTETTAQTGSASVITLRIIANTFSLNSTYASFFQWLESCL